MGAPNPADTPFKKKLPLNFIQVIFIKFLIENIEITINKINSALGDIVFSGITSNTHSGCNLLVLIKTDLGLLCKIILNPPY